MDRRRARIFALAGLLLLVAPCARAVLVSSHVFSNHKGGCGKTTILFHVACKYAMDHPNEKLLLGGDKGAVGKQGVSSVATMCSTTQLLGKAASVSSAESGPEPGRVSSFLGLLPARVLKRDAGAGGGKLVLEEQVLEAHRFNEAIPENLLLAPGGSGPQTKYADQQIAAIAATLRKALEESDGKWKLLVDTDGDQGFSDYTKIAHAVCDRCIIPLKTNVNDFSNRCIPMLEARAPHSAPPANELCQSRLRGEARSRVQMIVWNEIDIYKNAPSSVSGLITPPKATQGVINMLNTLVAEVAATYPDLFYNAAPDERADALALQAL
ncbi:hypothetical protein T484DRAFT_1810471 [Baffinella frigidus]|nr:hypothetical protein T484DRAFT_1810471 [Cryptophyta sp. CCMP2293]